jgi:hypothetical protein
MPMATMQTSSMKLRRLMERHLALLGSAPQDSDHQRNDEQHKENEKQNLGNFDRTHSDPAESEHGGNQRYNEEDSCVIEH